MKWIKVDFMTPEYQYFRVKDISGNIHIARLNIMYYCNSDDYYEWMTPHDKILDESIEYFSPNECKCVFSYDPCDHLAKCLLCGSFDMEKCEFTCHHRTRESYELRENND
jgi:hypothetical protein